MIEAQIMKDIVAKEVATKENALGNLAKQFETKPSSELNQPIEKQKGLSNIEKNMLKHETGWGSKVLDNVRTLREADVYKNAGLKEVNGNLERADIEWDGKIPQDRIERMEKLYGKEVAGKWADKTNLDLIKEGKAPYGKDGEPVSLHHIGQKFDSPLAELTDTEHKVNDGILHDKTKPSEINRHTFSGERSSYWKARYEALTNSQA